METVKQQAPVVQNLNHWDKILIHLYMLPIGRPSSSYFNYLGLEIIPPKPQMFTKWFHFLGKGPTCPLSLLLWSYSWQ